MVDLCHLLHCVGTLVCLHKYLLSYSGRSRFLYPNSYLLKHLNFGLCWLYLDIMKTRVKICPYMARMCYCIKLSRAVYTQRCTTEIYVYYIYVYYMYTICNVGKIHHLTHQCRDHSGSPHPKCIPTSTQAISTLPLVILMPSQSIENCCKSNLTGVFATSYFTCPIACLLCVVVTQPQELSCHCFTGILVACNCHQILKKKSSLHSTHRLSSYN